MSLPLQLVFPDRSVHAMDSAAYLTRYVSYTRKMFIKLATGVNIMKTVSFVTDAAAK